MWIYLQNSTSWWSCRSLWCHRTLRRSDASTYRMASRLISNLDQLMQVVLSQDSDRRLPFGKTLRIFNDAPHRWWDCWHRDECMHLHVTCLFWSVGVKLSRLGLGSMQYLCMWFMQFYMWKFVSQSCDASMMLNLNELWYLFMWLMHLHAKVYLGVTITIFSTCIVHHNPGHVRVIATGCRP